MSMAKYLSHAAAAAEWAKRNKKALGGAAAVGGAAIAAPHALHAWDDFMQDQAMKSMGRNVHRAAKDTVDYATKHPIAASLLMGGAAAAGNRYGADGIMDAASQFAPMDISALVKVRKKLRQQEDEGA